MASVWKGVRQIWGGREVGIQRALQLISTLGCQNTVDGLAVRRHPCVADVYPCDTGSYLPVQGFHSSITSVERRFKMAHKFFQVLDLFVQFLEI